MFDFSEARQVKNDSHIEKTADIISLVEALRPW